MTIPSLRREYLSEDLREVRDRASQRSDGKTLQAEGSAGAKALGWDPDHVRECSSLLSAVFFLKIDKHKCLPPKCCRERAASFPVTQPPVSLTLSAFLGLMCHWVASELPLLQKNGMGWGGALGGVRLTYYCQKWSWGYF